MGGIPEQIVDQVRERTDIVEVISRYVPLKKSGRNYKANCPFHHEKTPSFMVSPGKQIYHCFGCGEGGNVFSFLMKYERLEFPEVVKDLAKNAGIAIPEPTRYDAEKSSLAEAIHKINETALMFFHQNLLSNKAAHLARQYIAKRNIDTQTIERFKLGYAPKSWNSLLEYLIEKGHAESIIEKSGLAINGKDGRLFDRFRDKAIFPIFDVKGKVRGFGSRVLDDSQPKYMNSPDTYVYNKGSHLYGLHASWDDIREKNEAIVVEGYVDMLMPFQHGIRNIVASLGTALTIDQIRLLKRYTNNVIVLFDPDLAGENATIRSLDLFVEEDVKVRVAQLPKGYDPDSFVSEKGSEEFGRLILGAQDLFDYKLNLLIARHGAKTLEGKTMIANDMLPLIAKIKNAILQSGYLKRLSEMLSIDEADLKREIRKVKPDYTYRYQPGTKDAKSSKAGMAEKILAGLMLEDIRFVQAIMKDLTANDFRDTLIKRIVDKLFQLSSAQQQVSPSKLIDCFGGDEDVCACISELSATCENLMDKDKSMDDCIHWIRQSSLKERLKSLCGEIKQAQDEKDDSKVIDLVIQYNDMLKGVNPALPKRL